MTDYVETTGTYKMLLQIQQLCESAMKWDEDAATTSAGQDTPTLTDRAWLAKCILDILKEKIGT